MFGYLLKNSVMNCRVSENFDPLNPNLIPFSRIKYKIISSSFRFDNFTRLYTTSADDFDFFDGKSFDVSRDRPISLMSREYRRLQTHILGLTNTQLPHNFNCWIKLHQEASGQQGILGYSGSINSEAYVIFYFDQVGDTNKFIPNITTHIGMYDPDEIFTLPEITTDEWYFFSYNRDVVNKVVNFSINGGPFITQSYTVQMNANLDFFIMSLGAIETTSNRYIQPSSIGNYSFFDRPLKLKQVKSIFDLDKKNYGPIGIRIQLPGGGSVPKPTDIIKPPPDRWIKAPLTSGLNFDVNFNENTLISDFQYDGSIVGFDGSDFVANDGFVSVNTGGFLELDGALPNCVAQSVTDQSWIVQFKAFASSGQNIKTILITSPSDSGWGDLTGFRLVVTDLGITAMYYKGPNDILIDVSSYTIGPTVDLTIGFHQVIITYTPTTQTLNLYFDNEEPITRTAPTNNPMFYGAGSTIVLNKLTNRFPQDVIEYNRIGIYNRVLSQGEIFTIYNEIEQPISVEIVYDPNLLFDVNFNHSLNVDYTKDSNALVFQQGITLGEDYVTIKPGNHTELTSGIPEYLKNTGYQSWVFNFRSDAPHHQISFYFKLHQWGIILLSNNPKIIKQELMYQFMEIIRFSHFIKVHV
jgi:hypothetical protein